MFQRLFDCTVIERSLFGNCLFSGFGVISKTYTSSTIVYSGHCVMSASLFRTEAL
jgi:hypothetical protein